MPTSSFRPSSRSSKTPWTRWKKPAADPSKSSPRRQGNDVVLQFSDTGPGIREPERVFDPFYTTKPVGKGTGLGLSAVYGVVQDHGGQITCQNKPEGGALFVVRFPSRPRQTPQERRAGMCADQRRRLARRKARLRTATITSFEAHSVHLAQTPRSAVCRYRLVILSVAVLSGVAKDLRLPRLHCA